MDDLRAFVEAGLAERRREVDAVRSIVGEELEPLRRAQLGARSRAAGEGAARARRSRARR